MTSAPKTLRKSHTGVAPIQMTDCTFTDSATGVMTKLSDVWPRTSCGIPYDSRDVIWGGRNPPGRPKCKRCYP